MPRFYFDLRNGEEFTLDEEGVELNSIEAAKVEASYSLFELAKDNLPGEVRSKIAIEVRDEARLPLFQMSLVFEVTEVSARPER